MADRTQSPAGPPTQFGKYLLDGEIATGGMSRVFRARLRGPGGFEKKLVVKQILPELARDPQFVELFVQEANTIVQMSHSQIVPVYELGVVDGVYFLSMELVEGATVAEMLRLGPLSQELTAQIGLQISEALQYAHEKFQVVHRDVTPRNIIVDGQGNARLLDFGIALPVDQGGPQGVFGSPGYMPPEQASRKPVEPRSDLFSLGAVLHECITAKPAFPRSHSDPNEITTEMPTGLTGCDDRIATLINGMLEKDIADRPAAARQVTVTLRTWLAEKHPQGVARQLGERVEAAMTQAEQRRSLRPSDRPPPDGTEGSPGVRSIATSTALQEILQPESTEPLGTAQLDTTPPPRRRAHWTWILASAVLVLGVVSALRGSDTEQTERREGSGAERIERSGGQPAQAGSPTSLTSTTDGPAQDAQRPRSEQPAIDPPEPATPTPPTTPAAAAAPTPAPPTTPATAPTARVTINAKPWAHVKLDGKPLGTTPRRQVPVRAGRHTLELECPPLGKQARVPFTVSKPGALNIVVDLTRDPPSVRIQ